MSLTKTMPLSEALWLERCRAHNEAITPWTEAYRKRRNSGQKHPVYDFLFQYYAFSPTKLEQWHPGAGLALAHTPLTHETYAPHRIYHFEDTHLHLDPHQITTSLSTRIEGILALQQAIAERKPQFACFGLHEWAMVYRTPAPRHAQTPLRFPPKEIARIVESRNICCTHFDAFRFFTEKARPLNSFQPAHDTRIELEQCGCLHANMDLYKYAGMLFPWIGSDLLAQTFHLARHARELDMRASPYDLKAYGFEPVKIETEEGREEYATLQKHIHAQAQPLRAELIRQCEGLIGKEASPQACIPSSS